MLGFTVDSPVPPIPHSTRTSVGDGPCYLYVGIRGLIVLMYTVYGA